MPGGLARIDLHPREIARLVNEPVVKEACEGIAETIVERAQAAAPKASGRGAASIHAEEGEIDGVPVIYVSWTPEHFYLRFHEEGSEHQPARPFLRPAAESVRQT